MSQITIKALHPSGFEVCVPVQGTSLDAVDATIADLLARGYRPPFTSGDGWQKTPTGEPICPRHQVVMRLSKKTATQQRADRIEDLAGKLSLPRAAVEGASLQLAFSGDTPPPAMQPFADPDPLHELTFPSALDAKRAIADHLALSLATLAPEQL